ncbi:MAG: Na(+)-translocating NADH-quinone reductase subunit A [Saprospiraceae bacterium]|nr:Na(+)-translocating NADH-quinone reductase subunit A [Saprospiraceae bacterium]
MALIWEQPSTLTVVLIVIVVLVFFLLITVGNSLLQVRAKELGVLHFANYSVLPNQKDITGKSQTAEDVIRLRKGYDIKLKGSATSNVESIQVNSVAVQPTNVHGIAPIPKLEVAIGDTVKAGDPLFHDKNLERIKFVAPVSGEVVEVRRGAKRAITHVVLLADKKPSYRTLNVPDLQTVDREGLVEFLAQSGAWPLIKQRPYNVLAGLDIIPRDIFISTFDTAPLAPDNNLVVAGQENAFQQGLDVLKKLTPGKVHLGLDAGGSGAHEAFSKAEGVEKHWFQGPHPAGNVGVQIHHIDPILPGEKVWTLGVQDVITVGKLFTEKRYDSARIVALCGAEVKNPHYIQTVQGASLKELLKDQLIHDHVRVVSGDVLSGEGKQMDDFLNASDDQISVIKEGDVLELFGWLFPIKARPSISPTFLSSLISGTTFAGETNTHGEERAFVVTGNYEKVTPINMYPQHLLKSILAGNFERMEGLGIQEVVEEDLALCEFICPSKVHVQQILRQGMDMMIEQE